MSDFSMAMRHLARSRRLLVIGTLGVVGGCSVAYAASVVIATGSPAANFAVGIAPVGETGSGGANSASSARSSAKVIVVAGRQARLRISFAPRKGFSGKVRLSARGLPRGTRARFSRRAVTRAAPSSTLTIATWGRLARRTFRVAVDARGERGTRVVWAVVSVRYLGVRPRLVTVTAGQRATVKVALRRTTAGTPTRLSMEGLPAGAGGVFSPRRTTGPRATLTIATDAVRTPAGTSTLTVRSRYGTRTSVSRFRLRVLAPDSARFAIGGSVAGLAPGVTRAMNLALTSLSSHTLLISALRVGIASVTAPRASAALPCGTADFAVRQYRGPYPLRLPAGQTRTLAQLGVPEAAQPRVTMLNRPVNQDGCKAASLTFAYGGSARR